MSPARDELDKNVGNACGPSEALEGSAVGKTIPIFGVDAFASEPFAGNPAAVCLLPDARDDPWMQRVAREMNLSETAFVTLRPGGRDGYDLRWFTPAVEVDLCGHATLASAHVLWETGRLSVDETARFHTRSGLLTADRRDDWIVMDFPLTPDDPVEPPDGLLEALGVVSHYVGKSRFDYLVEVGSEAEVRGLTPDQERLKALPVRGVMVTSRAAAGPYDFVSRFFAPGAGIPEDPVTGSAHCCLASFWRRRLGRDEMLARQLSSRGGVVRVEVAGDRVRLGGQATTVWWGELLV